MAREEGAQWAPSSAVSGVPLPRHPAQLRPDPGLRTLVTERGREPADSTQRSAASLRRLSGLQWRKLERPSEVLARLRVESEHQVWIDGLDSQLDSAGAGLGACSALARHPGAHPPSGDRVQAEGHQRLVGGLAIRTRERATGRAVFFAGFTFEQHDTREEGAPPGDRGSTRHQRVGISELRDGLRLVRLA